MNAPGTPTITIEVSAKLLREGAGDEVLPYDSQAYRSREIPVRSMTYASNTVGRERGTLD
jgi:hypothetical protein